MGNLDLVVKWGKPYALGEIQVLDIATLYTNVQREALPHSKSEMGRAVGGAMLTRD